MWSQYLLENKFMFYLVKKREMMWTLSTPWRHIRGVEV